jgi:dTDP-4-amino-4,6-dideoxygalactose transaminase
MTAQIPLVALGRQHESLRDDLEAAFDRVMGSSGFILGKEVERFETDFAEYCGVRHCVGVASGTAALTLALQAGGIGAGDEVIVPAHTFIASALGVLHAGATPVFCDVHQGSGLIDLDSARAALTSRTAAVLPVHLYGQLCDMDDVLSFAARHGLSVFEDAAQAHGAEVNGRRAGSFGRAAAFSFYPSKNLGALGDGGAICTDDDGLARQARLLRNLGQRRKNDHVTAGANERLDGLQAALLRVKLPLSRAASQRRRAARGSPWLVRLPPLSDPGSRPGGARRTPFRGRRGDRRPLLARASPAAPADGVQARSRAPRGRSVGRRGAIAADLS